MQRNPVTNSGPSRVRQHPQCGTGRFSHRTAVPGQDQRHTKKAYKVFSVSATRKRKVNHKNYKRKANQRQKCSPSPAQGIHFWRAAHSPASALRWLNPRCSWQVTEKTGYEVSSVFYKFHKYFLKKLEYKVFSKILCQRVMWSNLETALPPVHGNYSFNLHRCFMS